MSSFPLGVCLLLMYLLSYGGGVEPRAHHMLDKLSTWSYTFGSFLLLLVFLRQIWFLYVA